jgi:hypothetical protein
MESTFARPMSARGHLRTNEMETARPAFSTQRRGSRTPAGEILGMGSRPDRAPERRGGRRSVSAESWENQGVQRARPTARESFHRRPRAPAPPFQRQCRGRSAGVVACSIHRAGRARSRASGSRGPVLKAKSPRPRRNAGRAFTESVRGLRYLTPCIQRLTNGDRTSKTIPAPRPSHITGSNTSA